MKNLLRFRIKDNLDYTKWFINNKFIPKELNNNEICLKDKKFENIIEKDSVVHEYIFTSLLILIFKEKYENKKKEKNKAFYYIHKNHYDNQMIFDFILNDYKKYKELNKDKNLIINFCFRFIGHKKFIYFITHSWADSFGSSIRPHNFNIFQ